MGEALQQAEQISAGNSTKEGSVLEPPRLQVSSYLVEMERQVIKDLHEQMRATLGRKTTPLEELISSRVTTTAVVCGVSLLIAYLFFGGILLFVAYTKNPGVMDKVITMYSGHVTISPPELSGSSLAWVAGLGFVALSIAISVVGIGASVALSRIGRE
jgi:hypothetical protein